MSSYNNGINWEALLYTLAVQTEAVPETLRQAHAKAIQASGSQRDEAVYRLRQQIEQYPSLRTAYQDGLRQVIRQNHSEVEFLIPTTYSFEDLLSSVFQSSNPVAEAKRHLIVKQTVSAPNSRFWDRSDRLVIMTIGGIAFGMTVAQVPGAILGGLAAVACWYYVTFVSVKSIQHL